jgi:hypothetical protein
MKIELKISIIIFSLLSLSQLSIAELKVSEQNSEIKSDTPKRLEVKPNSTKVGEDNTSKPKMRSLRMEHPEDSPQNSTNLNVGKLEFYVK